VRRRLTEATTIEGTTGELSRRSTPVWWAWLDLNQRPHPYQVSRAKRCAQGRFPRSLATVRGEGMRSNSPPDLDRPVPSTGSGHVHSSRGFLAPVVVRRLVVLMVAAGMGRQMTLLFGPD
jgi:hypothetical protein